MKSILVLIAVCLAVAMAMPQDNSGSGTEGGHGGGNEGGHHGGSRPPHPDCPELKTLISGKCTDRTNRDCFKCVFDGCHPQDTTTTPSCQDITTCVTANIAKC